VRNHTPLSASRRAPNAIPIDAGRPPTSRYGSRAVRPADQLHDPVVVEIENDFIRLPEAERARLTSEWVDSLRTNEPVDLDVTGAEMVAEARREAEW
jgi:hypothetical protein